MTTKFLDNKNCNFKILLPWRFPPECTKIAHRRSLAIFTADESIAGNSAARIIFTRFHRRKNRGSLAIFFAEEIAHIGATKNRAIFPGAVKIAAAAAENRAILVHSVSHEKQRFWTIFPSVPKAHPSQKCKLYFYCRLAVSELSLVLSGF